MALGPAGTAGENQGKWGGGERLLQPDERRLKEGSGRPEPLAGRQAQEVERRAQTSACPSSKGSREQGPQAHTPLITEE